MCRIRAKGLEYVFIVTFHAAFDGVLFLSIANISMALSFGRRHNNGIVERYMDGSCADLFEG